MRRRAPPAFSDDELREYAIKYFLTSEEAFPPGLPILATNKSQGEAIRRSAATGSVSVSCSDRKASIFYSCVLAGEGIMVTEVQCDECSIETLREGSTVDTCLRKSAS